MRILPIMMALAALAATGCRSAYKSAMASRNDVLFGSGNVAIERAEKFRKSTKTLELGNVELARLRMLSGDFAGSSAVLRPALEAKFDDSLTGPVIKKGNVVGTALASTLTDDMSIPYELPGFELLFALNYEWLNRNCLGDRETALVYLRRARRAQEQLKAEHASAGESPSGDDKNAAATSKAINTFNRQLSPAADLVRASYENALLWYLSGFYFERDDDPSNADIAYREAASISPALAGFARNPGADEVLVVYEEGLVDQREPIKIPLPIGGTVTSVDFPIYREQPYAATAMELAAEGGGIRLAKAVDVQALACRNLKDGIAGIVVRNVTRTATAIAAQQVANHVKTGDSTADAIIQLGVLAYNATHTVVSEADVRNWQTLPRCVQLARAARGAAKSVKLRNVSTGATMEIPLGDGAGSRIVWVTDLGTRAGVTVLDVDGKAAACHFATSSVMGASVIR